MENIIEGKDYLLENTLQNRVKSSQSNNDEYEQDEFEQELSDDELTLTEMQRKRINGYSALMKQSGQSSI